VRTPDEIRSEIDRLAGRRASVLAKLAAEPDPGLTLERRQLDARIAALWDEQRMSRATIRFGSRATIVARARRAERILRDPAREGRPRAA
jgi:hypothetical protein